MSDVLQVTRFCGSCGRPMADVLTAASGGVKAMPLDITPVEDGGNVWLSSRGALTVANVIGRGKQVPLEAAGLPLYVAHFVTCPDAARFRRR